MRTRQTAQGFDAADGYNGFGPRHAPSVDRDAPYGFRGAHPEPVRVHPHHLQNLHPHVHPQHPFGVVGPEQEFGVFPPPPYGPDASWYQANGYRGGGGSLRGHQREWGPTVDRYPGFSDNGYGEQRIIDELRSREGERRSARDSEGQQDLYRPHRGPHFGKGPKGYQRADDRIRDEICERLARDGYIDASSVEVAVAGGVVRLVGSVREPEDRHAVERVILDVYGVQEVRSELRLERSESQQPGNSNGEGDQGGRR